MDPKRVESQSNQDVHVCGCMVDIYVVVNQILLCSWKTYLSFETKKIFARKHGLSYSCLFFSGRHLSTHCFDNSDTCPFFSQLFFFMNNFCIATCFSLHNNCWRDSKKNLEHLFDGYLWKIFLVFTLSVGVKHF